MILLYYTVEFNTSSISRQPKILNFRKDLGSRRQKYNDTAHVRIAENLETSIDCFVCESCTKNYMFRKGRTVYNRPITHWSCMTGEKEFQAFATSTINQLQYLGLFKAVTKKCTVSGENLTKMHCGTIIIFGMQRRKKFNCD